MSEVSIETNSNFPNNQRRYVMAAFLLKKWGNEEADYDDRVWPVLEQELKEIAMQCREVFA